MNFFFLAASFFSFHRGLLAQFFSLILFSLALFNEGYSEGGRLPALVSANENHAYLV